MLAGDTWVLGSVGVVLAALVVDVIRGENDVVQLPGCGCCGGLLAHGCVGGGAMGAVCGGSGTAAGFDV